MTFRKLEAWFDILILCADTGKERRPNLPHGRAAGGGGMSEDGIGGGVSRPGGRPRCITAMITIREDNKMLGGGWCSRAVWF